MFSRTDKTNVDEELAKLSANFLNALAAGVTIVGSVSSIVNALLATSERQPAWVVLLLSSVCFAGGLALHLCARSILRKEFGS